MKNLFNKIALLTFSISLVSCSNEPETDIAPFTPAIFKETFPEPEINFNATFDFAGWTNYAEAGTKLWIERDFQNDGYIQFSSFQSGQASNIGWAITPKINLDETTNEILNFVTASNFITDSNNKIEVFISTNFDGTNAGVATATWAPLTAVVTSNLTSASTYPDVNSGDISLASYSGNIHIGFKVTGNGTTQTGSFQLDDVKIYSKN